MHVSLEGVTKTFRDLEEAPLSDKAVLPPNGARTFVNSGRFVGRYRVRRQRSVPGLVSVSEARASACVSIYSRMVFTLPFSSAMSKTQ
jgi:hypothetical protein